MKKQVRILLFAILAVLMLTLTVIGVSAAGEFKVTSTGRTYDTLSNAVSAVTSGGTIEVQASVSVSETQTLSNNVTYTIKGKTGSEVITFTGTAGLKITAGTVTMQNIGITAMGAHAVDVKGASANLTCQSGTTLISKGGSATTGGALVFGSSATVTIEDGTYQGLIWANEAATAIAHTTLTINGGSFSQNPTMLADTATDNLDNSLLRINKSYADLVVNGGTFVFISADNMASTASGLYLSGTTVTATINGGTFTGSGSKQCGLIDKRNGKLTIDNLPDDGKCPVFNVTGQVIALWVRNPSSQVSTTINDGIFTQGADVGSNKYFVVFQANLEEPVYINGGTFTTHAKGTYGVSLGHATNSYTTSLVIKGGKFCATAGGENTRLVTAFKGSNLTIDGGFFTYMDTLNGGLFTEDNIDVNNGFEYSNSLGVTNSAGIHLKTGGNVTITGGTFMCGDSYQTLYLDPGFSATLNISGGAYFVSGSASALAHMAGNVTITDGTFTSTGTDIIVVAAREGSLKIMGGTYTLAPGTETAGTVLRTEVFVTDQDDQDQYYDPTTLYQVPLVPITISGGRFNDFRDGNRKVMDTSIGSSLLTITEIFILTNSPQSYFIDAAEGLGQDVKMGDASRAYYSGGVQYYAYIYSSATENAPVMKDGAAVDLNPSYKEGDYNGIRFLSYIPASVVASLNLTLDSEFGTLIAPADYVAAAGGFTHAKMEALYNGSYGFDPESNPAYVEIRAVNTARIDTDGNIQFSGALVKLKENNNNRGFAAVAYIKVGDTYYYSTFDPSKNTRTMRDIAKQALTEYCEFTVDLDGKSYDYPSIYKPGAYSRYNEHTEQPLLQRYSGYYHSLTKDTVTLGLEGIYAADYDMASTNLQNAITNLAGVSGQDGNTYLIAGIIGDTFTRTSSELPAIDSSVYQALMASVQNEIGGDGYYIGVKYVCEGRVIDVMNMTAEQLESASCYVLAVGTSNALTLQALQVFERNYPNGGEVIISEIVHNSADIVTLNTDMPMMFEHTRDGNYINPYRNPSISKTDTGIPFNSSGDITHIYNKELNGYMYGQEGKFVDYPLVAGFEIGAAITSCGGTATFTDGYLYSFIPDNIKVDTFHIEIGLTDYAQNHILKGYDYGTYGYSIKDGRIVITAFDDATLRLAKQLFIDNLEDFLVDGVYQIPADLEYECLKTNGLTAAISAMRNYVQSHNADYTPYFQLQKFQFITSVPRPALTLSGAVDVGDNTLQLYYSENDVSLKAYTDYCEALQKAGYDVYMRERVVEDSRFVTYYNPNDDITLHVIYDAFAHASEGAVGASSTLADMFGPTLRVIAAKVDDKFVKLLPEEYLSLQTFTKRADTMITNVQITADSMGYCYIYTLEDGSFVVLDGGGINQIDRNVEIIYNTLSGLHKKITGEEPSASNQIKIAAWYLSHGHGDHMGTMNAFITKYVSVSSNTVAIEALIHNFPSNDEIYNSFDPTVALRNKYLEGNYYTNGTSKTNMIPYYKVHAGQVFFIRNLQFEVLYTHEDIHPWAMEFFNNTSTVIRLTALDTDGTGVPVVGSRSVDNIILGDLQARGSMVMRARYGDYLKSDMVAVSHHAGWGAEAALYQLIDAQVIWWTNIAETIDSRIDENSTQMRYRENAAWISSTGWLYIFALNPMTTPTDESGNTTYYNLTVTLTASGFPGLYSRLESDTINSLASKQTAAQDALLANLFAMQVVEDSSKFSYAVGEPGAHGVTFGDGDKYVTGRQDLSYELPITYPEPEREIGDRVEDPFVSDEILEIIW